MARKTHYVLSGTAKIAFVTEDNYAIIGAATGVFLLAPNEAVDAVSTVGNLFRYGQAMRLVVRYKNNAGKVKTARIICDIDKAPTAIAALRNQSFKGGTIQSVAIPRRRRLG